MPLSAALGERGLRSSVCETTLARHPKKESSEKVEVEKLHEGDRHGGYRIT